MSRSHLRLVHQSSRRLSVRPRRAAPGWARSRRSTGSRNSGLPRWWASIIVVAMAFAVVAVRELALPSLENTDRATVPSRVTASTVRVGDRFRGTVSRIVDGDTFWISSADVRIRVWALDAPERDAPGFDAATEALRRLIDGRTLTCRTRDIDRFGRIVGQCFLPDGRDITRTMIQSGTAREFCRFSRNHYGTCVQ